MLRPGASNELVRLTAGECGAEGPARPVRFRRHARQLGWGGGDHVCGGETGMSTEDRKALVHRLVAEVSIEGRLRGVGARRGLPSPAWIAPFRVSFSDPELEIVQLVAEGDTVVARFVCSGTHSGVWLGHPRRTDDSIGWLRSTSSA